MLMRLQIDRVESFEVGLRAVLALGNAQSGRYLRTYTASGFNQDEVQRRVFDGVLTGQTGALLRARQQTLLPAAAMVQK
jgi:hypothetical protein